MSFDVDLPSLVASAQSGDVGAISELYNRYASVILRYLFARVYERELAQDLTQEVFIRVIKGINQFEYRGEKSLLGWLYTIASNVLSSYQRRRKIPSTPLDQQTEVADARSQEDVRLVCDRIALQQAIEQLTDDQQQVLALRFFADMTNGEIAIALNRTEGSVKALQHRALQSLQNILAREEERKPPPRAVLQAETFSGRQKAEMHSLQQHELGQSRPLCDVSVSHLETHTGD